jgi:L-amino acid N-acyltransferase YncA
MKIYRHYKSKLYRYQGLVKHSETLEELVAYECLYDNPEGAHWVRPKTMFFDTLLHDGKTKPRFEKLELNCVFFEQVLAKQREDIVQLAKNIAPDIDPIHFQLQWDRHSSVHLHLAVCEEKTLGFLLASPLREERWLLWFGGVLSPHRRWGIASELLEKAIRRYKAAGCRCFVTRVFASETAVLGLCLKAGFQIVGAEDAGNGLELVLERFLAHDP